MPPTGATPALDDQRFTALIEQAAPKLRSFAQRLCGDGTDADDVLQEALAKAWRLRASFDAGRTRPIGQASATQSVGRQDAEPQDAEPQGVEPRSSEPRSVDLHARAAAWLQRIVFTTFCDLRATRRRQPASSGDDLQSRPAPAATCRTELRDELKHTLTRLPEMERTLLLAFHRDGLSVRELAQHHELPLNTVKSHLHRARRRLHQTHVRPAHGEGGTCS